jgi:hypothetical protein
VKWLVIGLAAVLVGLVVGLLVMLKSDRPPAIASPFHGSD